MNVSKQVNVMIGLLFVFLLGTMLYFLWDNVRAEDALERQIVTNAERGGGLFSLNCRACHGISGLGSLENPNLPGLPLNLETNRPDDPGKLMERQNIVRDTIRCGRVGTLMPQWAEEQGGPLNDFQIEQLVTLITGAMPGLEPPDDLNAVSKKGWERVVEEADHADLLALGEAHAEGRRLARSVGDADTVFVLVDAQELTVDSLLRIDGEVVRIVDAPARSSLLEGVAVGQTDLPVDKAGDLFRSADIVQIEGEQLRVVSVPEEDTLRVERGVEDTTAKSHRVNAAVFEPSDEIVVERGVFGTQAVEHEEGAQVFAGPLEPPSGPLTGEGGIPPCGQRFGAGAPAPAPSPTPTPAEGGTPAAGGDTAEIKMIPTILFDQTELTIAANTEVTVTADNTDNGIPHNFAVYTSRDAAESGEEALGATEICIGPCTGTATVNLSAGEYFFRCDVHPQQMMGRVVVTE